MIHPGELRTFWLGDVEAIYIVLHKVPDYCGQPAWRVACISAYKGDLPSWNGPKLNYSDFPEASIKGDKLLSLGREINNEQ